VHALDAVEFDVRGCRRAGDESYGPSLGLYRVFEFGEGFGDEAYDLVLPHDAQVVVGQEGERPAALGSPGVEDDGAGLGYPQSTAGQHAVAVIELIVGEPSPGRAS
jgi:hypothetical protein